jgi:hypothetical protein
MKPSRPVLAIGIVSLMLLMPAAGICQVFSKTTPTVHNLNALWGTTDQNAFSAGDSGTILLFDGTTWTPQTSNTVFDLHAMWLTPVDTSFVAFTAGASGVILSNIGTGWTQAVSPTSNNIRSLWAASSSDVFAVGDQGVILQFDGHTWIEMANTGTAGINLFSVWGFSGSNVYAGGAGGQLFHFDGTGWTPVPDFPSNEDIRAVWGSSPTDIFAAGSLGDIVHFDGIQWTIQDSVNTFFINAIWGSSSTDVFAAGQSGKIFQFNGTSWTEITPFGISINNINAIWGSTSGNVFFASQAGDIVQLTRQDIISPIVLSSNPSDGQTDIPFSTAIAFQFSEKMDAATINTSSITLVSGSSPVPGQVNLSSDGLIATFNPDNALANSSIYTATVASGVKDLAGNTLKSPFAITFTTTQKATAESTSGGGGGGSGVCFISCARL